MSSLQIQPEFIIEACLLGIGLVIALYTLIYPKIALILEKQAKNVVELEKKFNEESSHLSKVESNKERSEIVGNLRKIDENIKSEYVPSYELYYGVIISMVLLSIPVLVYAFPIFNIAVLSTLEPAIPKIFFAGLISVVVLFFLIFIRLHTIIMNDFDKKVQKTREDTTKKLENIL